MGDGAHTRIIPARAGFTAPVKQNPGNGGDHPRSRGVYAEDVGAPEIIGRSSPLARGLRRIQGLAAPDGRIIPARAGFTSSPAAPRRSGPDHPRSRGVYLRMKRQLGPESGSSPLARGLLPSHIRETNQAGIIPARAGFTSSASDHPARSRDHPRSRGVYARCPACDTQWEGSSPLARGLQDPPRPRAAVLGIIPARAGFTKRITESSPSLTDHPRSRGVYSTS